MKKNLLLILACLMVSVCAMAQSAPSKKGIVNGTKYVERIESKLTLNDGEKEKIITLKAVHYDKLMVLNKEYADKPELQEKRKACGREFGKTMNDEFGKVRARELMQASKKAKK